MSREATLSRTIGYFCVLTHAHRAAGQADVLDSSNDPEQQRVFGEIVELLLSAGYFRARISGLSPFDKVVGGLAWAITASSTCSLLPSRATIDVACFRLEPNIYPIRFHPLHAR